MLATVVFALCARAAWCAVDYYAVLGVPSTASQADIKRAYRRLAKEKHPDVNKAPDAEQEFIRLQEAHETLSDPAARRQHDAEVRMERMHSQRGHGGAWRPRRREYPGRSFLRSDEVRNAIGGEDLWLLHMHTHRHDHFGGWMFEIPGFINLGHVNMDHSSDLRSVALLVAANHRLSSPFLAVCQRGAVLPFNVQTSFFFDNTLSSVRQHALSFVDYWQAVELLEDGDHLQSFLAFRPGGSSRLRVVFFSTEGDPSQPEKFFEVFEAATVLQRKALVAQIYYGLLDESYFAQLGITRIPAAVMHDPITGTSKVYEAKAREGDGFFTRVGRYAGKLLGGSEALAGMLLIQELDEESWQRRCSGGGSCDWTFALATDEAFEANVGALSQAMATFSRACQSLVALRDRLSWGFACFWLRLQRAPGWAALLPGLKASPAGGHRAAIALGGGQLVRAPDDAWGLRSLFLWFRKAAGDGGAVHGGVAEALPRARWPPFPHMLTRADEPREPISLSNLRRMARHLQRDLARLLSEALEEALGRASQAWVEMTWGTPLQALQPEMVALFVCLFVLILMVFMGPVAWLLDWFEGELTEEDVLRGLRRELCVSLRRDGDQMLGFRFGAHPQGGLEVKQVQEGGLLHVWNSSQPPHGRVQIGDQIVCAYYMKDGSRVAADASSPAELRRALLECSWVTLRLLPVAAGGAPENMRATVGVVCLKGMSLKDAASLCVSEGQTVQVVRVHARLAEWNRARRAEGACCTQCLEVGDRIVSVGGKLDVAQQITVQSPVLLVVRWAPAGALGLHKVLVELERSSPQDSWGLQCRRSRPLMSLEDRPPNMWVRAVSPSSVVARHNESCGGTEGMALDRRCQSPFRGVLVGDRVTSLNGQTDTQRIADEERGLKISVALERLVEWWRLEEQGVASSPSAGRLGAGEDEAINRQPTAHEDRACGHAAQQACAAVPRPEIQASDQQPDCAPVERARPQSASPHGEQAGLPGWLAAALALLLLAAGAVQSPLVQRKGLQLKRDLGRLLGPALSRALSGLSHAWRELARGTDLQASELAAICFGMFILILMLFMGPVTWLLDWYFKRGPTEEEVLRSLQCELFVPFVGRQEGQKLGFRFEVRAKGELPEVTEVQEGGLLDAWNSQQPPHRRVQHGDHLLSIYYTKGGRCVVADATDPVEMRRVLVECPTLTLRLLPRAEALRATVGVVRLQDMTLKDAAALCVSQGQTLQVLRATPRLARWSAARRAEGACCMQCLEEGDRIVSVSGKLDVSQQVAVQSPVLLVVRWVPAGAIELQRIVVELERASPQDAWGVLCRRSAALASLEDRPPNLWVRGVVEKSVASRHNDSCSGAPIGPHSPAFRGVLAGDRLVALNGQTSMERIAAEEKGLRISLTLERLVESWRAQEWRPSQPAPRSEQPATHSQQLAPYGERPAPCSEQPTPRGEQPAPCSDHLAPRGEQPTPRCEQPAPHSEQHTPRGGHPSAHSGQPSSILHGEQAQGGLREEGARRPQQPGLHSRQPVQHSHQTGSHRQEEQSGGGVGQAEVAAQHTQVAPAPARPPVCWAEHARVCLAELGAPLEDYLARFPEFSRIDELGKLADRAKGGSCIRERRRVTSRSGQSGSALGTHAS